MQLIRFFKTKLRERSMMQQGQKERVVLVGVKVRAVINGGRDKGSIRTNGSRLISKRRLRRWQMNLRSAWKSKRRDLTKSSGVNKRATIKTNGKRKTSTGKTLTGTRTLVKTTARSRESF